MAVVVDVPGLTMAYGSTVALAGIDLQVHEGEILTLLGPNGAGKTTTVEILEGYRRRDGGRLSVLGFDPERGGARFRERIGIVLQSSGFDPELTVAETVGLYRSFYPAPRSGG